MQLNKRSFVNNLYSENLRSAIISLEYSYKLVRTVCRSEKYHTCRSFFSHNQFLQKLPVTNEYLIMLKFLVINECLMTEIEIEKGYVMIAFSVFIID